LLAVRLGCALAAQAAAGGSIGPLVRTVLWQPIFDGGRFLTQFLRLRTAASLMEDRKETVAELRERLMQGAVLEVAGYGVGGPLACDLDAVAAPDTLPVHLGDAAWMEMTRGAGGELPLPSAQLIDRSRYAGLSLRSALFVGEPFWASTEIVSNTKMIDATVEHLATDAASDG
jgi:hypothetical protein